MGVDHLDIMFRIETTFQVEMSKHDFEGLVHDFDITAGDLYDWLLKKLHLRDVGRLDYGLNLQLWSQIQRELSGATGLPHEQIQLHVPLARLFPDEIRRETWDALRDASPYRIPELDYPPFVRCLGYLLATGVVSIELLHFWLLLPFNFLWPVIGTFGLWLIGESYLKIMPVFAPLRNRFPDRLATVKDLCRSVLAANYTQICTAAPPLADERSLSVWDQLVEILSKSLGIDSSEVTFRSRLVRDLGMG